MKIALAQLNYHIGNLEANTQKIIQAIEQAKQQKADLIVFAELAICGYPPLDLLEFTNFIDLCEHAVEQIAGVCDNIACIIGAPVRNTDLKGKDLYNSAVFIENKKRKATIYKTLLPNYDVFDECRYFEPSVATKIHCIDLMGFKIALTICEDLWNMNHNPLYVESPMDILIREKPDLMINIAASPFSYRHHKERVSVLKNNCHQYNLPLFYVNQVGAQTEIIFDGRSLVFDKQGHVVDEMPGFTEAMHYYNLTVPFSREIDIHPQHKSSKTKNFDQVRSEQKGGLDIAAPKETSVLGIEDAMPFIHDALILGIQDYFKKSGFSKAILGLSGGIDSALVCVLASKALGPENVMAVLMPSEFSSDHSIKDALDLVENLGCKHEIISVKKAVSAFDVMMKPLFNDLPFNIAEENIQSRCRAVTVMAMSNKFGYILLNTSNKSELAVGYGTLYGDMAGAMGVIGDIYKIQVYQLCEYINRDQEIIPKNILIKPPSAELRPGQKDSDSLPTYDVLDQILFEYIELKKSPSAIIALGFEEVLVYRILKLVNAAEFKRYQTPPILRVSPKAFGLGRRMPIVGKYLF